MGRITTTEKEKVNDVVHGRGRQVTYIPGCGAVMIFILMAILAYVIGNLLLKLQPGLIMPPFMFGA